jgi:hypothetical protein
MGGTLGNERDGIRRVDYGGGRLMITDFSQTGSGGGKALQALFRVAAQTMQPMSVHTPGGASPP